MERCLELPDPLTLGLLVHALPLHASDDILPRRGGAIRRSTEAWFVRSDDKVKELDKDVWRQRVDVNFDLFSGLWHEIEHLLEQKIRKYVLRESQGRPHR